MNPLGLLSFACLCFGLVLCNEESGCLEMSKFDYEFKMVQKMVQMEADKREMDATIGKFETLLSTFTTRMNSFETTISSFTSKMEIADSLQGKITTLEDTTEHLKEEVQEKFDNSSKSFGQKVAFTAVLSSNPNYNNGATIVFDTVKTDIGGGYSADTGVFTAPITGLYQFSLSITSYRRCQVDATIIKGSDEMGKAFAGGYNHGGSSYGNYASAAVTVLMELSKGDTVYVKMNSKTCNSGSYTIWGGRSYFSGLLITTK